jgi:hypothetical protein
LDNSKEDSASGNSGVYNKFTGPSFLTKKHFDFRLQFGHLPRY